MLFDRVNVIKIGTKGDGIEPRNLAAEQTALETCVDCLDLHVLPVLVLVDFAHHVAQVRLAAVFPRGVFPRNAQRAVEPFGKKPDSAQQQLLAACNRASDGARSPRDPSR